MTDFQQFLIENRKVKKIQIFFDIETLQFNTKKGEEKPSDYKNVTYSFAFGYLQDHEVKVHIYSSFKQFIDEVIEAFKKWKQSPKIELIAHNTNKYDNHFLRYDLLYNYNMTVENLFLRNANDEANQVATKKTKITAKQKKDGLLLEKRIKSSNNLELNFYLDNVEFYTTDNYMKTNASIKTLGYKLLQLGVITENDLKTDYDYEKYNKEYDMTPDHAYQYAQQVFDNLTDDELLYIRNDIIILANSVIHYSKLFKGFDYNRITFTSNILEYYNDNDLTSYQLLKSVGKGKNKIDINYTNYAFDNQNFYDYLKSFYNGGLNFYNDQLVGKIITDEAIAMDINSSYPYAMHNYKVPTFISDYESYNGISKEITIPDHDDNFYYLYRMSKQNFDYYIINNIESKIIKQMLVKYYGRKETININTYTLLMIEEITGVKIERIRVLSWVKWECEYFASRDKISEKYFIKTQGSSNKIINYADPYNIVPTDQENEQPFTREEIDISKVILNGLYGIPALRSHFNIFRWVGSELINIQNGYANNERNIVFSVFVTSVSLFNLLQPLKYLQQKEIDDNFIYCDTDSLYLKKTVESKISKDIFHPDHLGAWGMDETNIQKMVVLNHKKYAYEVIEDNQPKIVVKSGGVQLSNYNTDMPFNDFVQTQFSDGCIIKTSKAIFNKQGTISIYPSETELQVGSPYPMKAYDPVLDQLREKMLEEIRNDFDTTDDNIIYIESNLGTYSQSDIFPVEHDKNQMGLNFLKLDEEQIKNMI